MPVLGGVEDAAPPPPEQPFAPVATLAGEWRVAGLDGEPLDQLSGVALSASDTEIWWEPRCAAMAVSYRIDGLRISTGEPEPPTPVQPGEPTSPICTVNPPPPVRDLIRALDVADAVGRTPENGVLISGGGHSVLLFSQ